MKQRWLKQMRTLFIDDLDGNAEGPVRFGLDGAGWPRKRFDGFATSWHSGASWVTSIW